MKLKEKIKIFDRYKIIDNRGWFLKVLTGKESYLPNHTGEIYITSAKINESKGGHYHKEANEWFTLLVGECELLLVDIFTDEAMKLNLDSSIPQTVFVPPNVAHIFVNSGNEDFLLMAYSDLLYNPVDTIPFDKFDI